jgi:hypothetical protein
MLYFSVAVSLMTGAISAAHAQLITANLQGYWQFNGGGADSSGMNRPVNIVGGPGFGAGLIGQSLSLVGNAGQYAVRPVNDTIFDLNGNLTVQIWANFNTIPQEQTLIEKFSNIAGPGWTLTKLPDWVATYKFRWHVDGGPGEFDSSLLSIPTGAWHQFVARRNGADWSLFFNGVNVANQSNLGAPTISSNPLLMGRRWDNSQQFPLDGRLDEAAIWNRALSNSEIALLWNNGQGFDMTTVPEPTSLALTGLVLSALAVRRVMKPLTC